MKTCVFVDGENFRHSLNNLLGDDFNTKDHLPKNAKWTEFFDDLSDHACSQSRLRTYWYVVDKLLFDPWDHKSDDPVRQQRRHTIEKRFTGWNTIYNAIAKRSEAVEFRRAGTVTYSLADDRFKNEKAVDVKLAVDLLELSDIYDAAIIVSGDGDYVPVVQAIKNKGKRVTNVSFTTRSNDLLPGGARSLNEITDSVIKVSYTEMKRFMGFTL